MEMVNDCGGKIEVLIYIGNGIYCIFIKCFIFIISRCKVVYFRLLLVYYKLNCKFSSIKCL